MRCGICTLIELAREEFYRKGVTAAGIGESRGACLSEAFGENELRSLLEELIGNAIYKITLKDAEAADLRQAKSFL